MATHDKNPLTEVYTGTSWQAKIVKGLLEANGIQAALRDNSPASIIMPDIEGSSVSVIVNHEDAPLAKKVIRENEDKE